MKAAFAFIFAMVFGFNGYSQQFKFNHYTASNGLTHQYIYDIEQTNSGYLWLGTSTGVIRFDGHAFELFSTKNGLAEDFTTRLFVSTDGQMWAGHNQGGITVYKNGIFKKVIGSASGFSNIVGFDELPGNAVVAAGQSGKIFLWRKESDNVYDLSGDDMLVSAMAVAGDNCLLLGTDMGIYRYKIRKYEPNMGSKKLLESIPQEKIQCIVKSKRSPNVLWTATAAGEIYKIQLKGNDEIVTQKIETGSKLFDGIQDIFEDNVGNLWISSYGGVHKLVPSSVETVFSPEISYAQSNGLPSDQIKCVFQDKDDNKWFGMYGAGLAMLKDEFFTFYQYKSPKFNNNVQEIFFDQSKKYFGSEAGLGCFSCLFASDEFDFPEGKGMEKYSIVALRKFNGILLAGTSKDGVFAYNAAEGKWKNVFFSKTDNLLNSITDIEVTDSSVWVGTRSGLYELNNYFAVKRFFNTETGLGHNSINDIYIDKRGRIWATSQSNMVACIDGKMFDLIEVTAPTQSFNIVSITQDAQNRIWMATYGDGLFMQEDKKFVQISASQGLASDYCYFVAAGRKNTIWVGHRGALSLIQRGGKKITVFSTPDGIDHDFNQRAAFRDAEGSLWFGSTKGIVKFDPKKYNDKLAKPKINIKTILLSDKQVAVNKSLELPYGNYRLVISFIGINFNNPQKVKYKYILKGFDLDWSDVTSNNQAYYPKLSDGEYEFIVKASNDDGEFGNSVASFKINVAYPFWKQWWFLILCFLVLVGIVALIIHLRERAQKKIRLYLEKQLKIRTHELVEQKELVDQKNKDITDSINYAYKIQSGLLPSIAEIKKHLPQFFVVYKPRDIISGDFYWCRVKDNIISIAVADCTGHGVPGAFLSAIGNLIFRKIAEFDNTADPALFISQVDEYLISLMSPDPNSLTHDGMDMVLVMIDTNTGSVVFSGAKRPVVLVKADGTSSIHKTSFESLGGAVHSKTFTNTAIQLEKGDSIYLYSDGIVDQFGGAAGKKIMTRGFVQLLEQNAHLTMDEQGRFLSEYFDNWKGENSQVDDVLVMGIRY
ncbi:MAG TPA: two-component regulator propeller domain-containing protein [Flavobacteriales bacterium]|nr:two-component regulator propeller domain-containing protein [Flavobacteriales bacterium]